MSVVKHYLSDEQPGVKTNDISLDAEGPKYFQTGCSGTFSSAETRIRK